LPLFRRWNIKKAVPNGKPVDPRFFDDLSFLSSDLPDFDRSKYRYKEDVDLVDEKVESGRQILLNKNQNEYGKAFSLLYPAAEFKDNSIAQYLVGVMFAYGLGVNASEKEAFKWFKKSAYAGHPYAQYFLGDALYWSKGTGYSFNSAIKALNESRHYGNGKASLFLA